MAVLHYIHHAAFSLTAHNEVALFDPFLDGNPEGLTEETLNAKWIFVSHAHHDHIGSAVAIAKRTGATIISTAEVCSLVGEAGCNTHSMHWGGTREFDFGKVRIAPAFHGSGVNGGLACGFIVHYWGAKIYFAGDTAVFGDMALLQRLDSFDIALLPIGGNWTMNAKDAVIAAEFLKAKTIVPMHYNTWPLIAADPEQFKKDVQSHLPTKVEILKPGEEMTI